MKILSLISTTLLILLFLCACNDDEATPQSQTGLEGNWIWIQSSGGIGGFIYTPESEGYEIRLEITDSNFTSYRNDTLTFSNTYLLEVRPDTFANTNEYLVFSEEIEQAVRISGDSLWSYDLMVEGYTNFYLRE